MVKYWWQLPGPGKFISNITQDLRDGKNVIILLPEYAPKGIFRALKNAYEFYNIGQWYTLDIGEEYNSSILPVYFLFNKFAPNLKSYEIRNIHTLLKQEAFCEKVIYLDNINSKVWPLWKEFLTEYEHACRSTSLVDRTLFCVPLIGELALKPIKKEACIVHHSWENIISYFDMLLYTLQCFHSKPLKDLQKKISVGITTNIALWDPEIAERLSYEKIDVILNPVSFLKSIARERNWENKETTLERLKWHKGMIDKIDGEEKIHSAVLSLNDPYKEIERRIWNAEVGIIFPFIEECRRKILENYGGLLEIPFTTRFGEKIKELRDLEIGHIESQILGNEIQIDFKIKRNISRLRELRNSLSHLLPVDPELLIDKEGILSIKFK